MGSKLPELFSREVIEAGSRKGILKGLEGSMHVRATNGCWSGGGEEWKELSPWSWENWIRISSICVTVDKFVFLEVK